MKKIFTLLFLFICIGFLFQNCGQFHEVESKRISCENAGISGSWVSSDLGWDHMNIQGCQVSSSRCGSESQIKIKELNEGCPESANTCGVAEVITTYTNGSYGCLPQGSATCSFVKYNNGSNLVYNCGNSSLMYSRY